MIIFQVVVPLSLRLSSPSLSFCSDLFLCCATVFWLLSLYCLLKKTKLFCCQNSFQGLSNHQQIKILLQLNLVNLTVLISKLLLVHFTTVKFSKFHFYFRITKFLFSEINLLCIPWITIAFTLVIYISWMILHYQVDMKSFLGELLINCSIALIFKSLYARMIPTLCRHTQCVDSVHPSNADKGWYSIAWNTNVNSVVIQ